MSGIGLPTLARQESDNSEWTADAEKEGVKHIDNARLDVPEAILEEDEGPNVGMAAYEASKQMGEIVCPFFPLLIEITG